MTLTEFKTQMRTNRGKLSSKAIDKALDNLYFTSSKDMLNFMVPTKTIGVKKALEFADRLTTREQEELIRCIKMSSHKPSIATIEMFVDSIILDR